MMLARLAAVAALLIASGAAAQKAPEQVAADYVETMRGARWEAAAELMHPTALASFRRVVDRVGEMGGPVVLDSIFGLQAAALPGLSNEQVFARVLGRMMSANPAAQQAMSTAQYRAVATVMAGDTAHVDYEMDVTINGRAVTVPSRISFLRDGVAWKALLTRGTEEMMARLEGVFAA